MTFVIVILIFLSGNEDCLAGFKNSNCNLLQNKNSDVCQYYRACLAEDDRFSFVEMLFSFGTMGVMSLVLFLRGFRIK